MCHPDDIIYLCRMRLKRLIIKGFKSFADETVINFDENLIGIVGPNGSGKSNIVDSIRWVLGEQKTKELRLEAMSDVIFNGSKDRKEGKIAKVTLIFDNTKHILPTEFNEVSIGRVLYRNGTSEYLLNNVSCRKKDITNLFIDSGIGSNSYAIISLNMVEDILHDSGGSRRHMIEQAAGISKYKARKKETLSKLRGTIEDLDRVKDLLYEIEKNMALFERQAKRTERFNKLKEDYKELSIKISHIEVKDLNEKYLEIENKLNKEKDARVKINSELARDEALLQQLKSNIIDSEKSLNTDQQSYNQLIEQLGQVENEKNLTIQKLQNSKDRIREIDNGIDTLLTEKDQSVTKKGEKEQECDTLHKELSKVQKEYEDINDDYQKKSVQYESLREREKQLQSALYSQQNLKENLGREVESLSTRRAILESDIVGIESRSKHLKTELGEVEKVLTSHNDLIDTRSIDIEKFEKELEDLENEVTELNSKINEMTKVQNESDVKSSGIEQRIQFLQNIIENNEGMPESVKHILQEKKLKFPVLSDVIEIEKEEYIEIAELYLEPWFYYILVGSRAEASKVIEQVKGAQKGKVNIAILDEIISPQPQASKNGLLPLSDVINVKSKYQPFLNSVAENVFISPKIYDHSSDSYPKDKVVLFPKDYLISAYGKLYGGSRSLFEGIHLGRKQQLEKLHLKLKNLKQDVLDNQDKIDAENRRLEELKSKISERRLTLAELKLQFDLDKSKLYEVQSKIGNINSNYSELEALLEAKKAEISSVNSDLSLKSLEYDSLKNQNMEDLDDKSLALEVEVAHNSYIQARAQRDDMQSTLYGQKSKTDLAVKDLELIKTSILSIDTRMSKMQEEQEAQKNLVIQYESDLEKIKGDLESKYVEKEEIQKKLSSYEDTYYKEKGKIFELEKGISELRNKIYSKDQLINSLNDKFVNTGFEIKAIHERNSIEFGIEINSSDFPQEYEVENVDELKTKKGKIFDRIRSFGEINPMAITAYNEIKERHDEISKERDDIISAKTSLEETIAEIESTASRKFNEALNDIRINFKDVFQNLFSDDDDCDIVLLDNEDPLEAKIEIIAKPKGKRPKSINLLSGGEKTLTAASFLFALYLLKPAPFCIFDEVDAPLDDVNILKFNRLIRKFSDDSQFIIITHNKLTMQEVDVLYGVYLKEQGVSGLSAVDFRTYDHTEMVAAS